MPAGPGVEEFGTIAAGGEDVRKLIEVEALAGFAILPFAVAAFQVGSFARDIALKIVFHHFGVTTWLLDSCLVREEFQKRLA